jgi:ketosteroid isomerase-like protein
MKAEFDKKMTGPDSMGELWTDDFFDVLPGGRVVNKQEMMDLMAKTERQPGTGAFPDHFKLMAVYGNVALATDHTVIKGVDPNGKIVVVREMGVLRMFVKEKGKWRVAGAGLVPIVAQ